LRGLSCLRGKLARAVLRGGDGGNTVSLLDYDWRGRQVTEIRDGVLYPTRFASPQGVLIPRNARESLVVCRPQVPRRQARQFNSTQQLVLFELMYTG
jgi:hypothetical protein